MYIRKKIHYVFDNVKEFENHFMVNAGVVPELKSNWHISSVGDWVFSDDNKIVQILSRKEYKSKRTPMAVFYRTVVGTFIANKSVMDTNFSLRKYPIGRYQVTKNYANWLVKQKFRDKLTSKEKQFIKLLFDGETKENAYFQVYNCIYLKAAAKKAKNLLKQPRIIGAIMGKTPKELAEKLGIGVQGILNNYKKLFEESKDEKFKKEVNDKLADIIDITEERSKVNMLTFSTPQVAGSAADRKALLEAKEDDYEIEE